MSKPSGCGNLPQLHSMILEQLFDGVIALDQDGRIVFWNRAAERLFRLAACAVLGRRPHDVPLSPWFNAADEEAAVSAARRGEVVRREHAHRNGNGASGHLEFSITGLADADGASAGMLVVLRDISGAKRREHDLMRQVDALRGPSEPVRLIQDLVPICSHCKQIRDAGGAWHDADAYLHKQCGVRFTHGICPRCITHLHPDYDGDPPASR